MLTRVDLGDFVTPTLKGFWNDYQRLDQNQQWGWTFHWWAMRLASKIFVPTLWRGLGWSGLCKKFGTFLVIFCGTVVRTKWTPGGSRRFWKAKLVHFLYKNAWVKMLSVALGRRVRAIVDGKFAREAWPRSPICFWNSIPHAANPGPKPSPAASHKAFL